MSETNTPRVSPPSWQVWAEWACVFAVFALHGAWPVPDVNEPYYLGKAIHYWNDDWVAGDFFLQSADSHLVFYVTFGWLSLWLPPLALAWTGRVLTWLLMAWAWRRLSWAVAPRPWLAVVSAALFLMLVERCHMAGEWVAGGVEAKGFAFVLVFLALEGLVRGRWNRTWLLLGAASAFHVLVGGWSVVAAGAAWLLDRQRPPLRTMLAGLLGGLALALPGLLPTLTLTWGMDHDVTKSASLIYVYERLSHHLVPEAFRGEYVRRFLAVVVLWGVLAWRLPSDPGLRRLHGFVSGALAIALAGVGVGLLRHYDKGLAAELLRFYWFRLSDVAVPLGLALAGASLFARREAFARRTWEWMVDGALVGASAILAIHLGAVAWRVVTPQVPRAEMTVYYDGWRDACHWIRTSGEIPADARFLTPRLSSTFKWRAQRAEVVNWKEIPQDARAIVLWWAQLRDIHGANYRQKGWWWYPSLAMRHPNALRELAARYQADYLLIEARPPRPFPLIYTNRVYTVYRMDDTAAARPSE